MSLNKDFMDCSKADTYMVIKKTTMLCETPEKYSKVMDKRISVIKQDDVYLPFVL